jgi:ATP-binding cassette subfamily F protein 3
MLLRPSNTLLLDEPTNHLDLDSKEVLLDALVDYGGTLIFVSHDRYFVERLATKIIEVGHGGALVYPGTYKEFLWHKEHPLGRDGQEGRDGRNRQGEKKEPEKGRREDDRRPVLETRERHSASTSGVGVEPRAGKEREAKKRVDAEARKRQRAAHAHQQRIDQLEARIAECEASIRELEQMMAAPGFYDDRAAAQPFIDRHQALMWKVGDLMHQWEELQSIPDVAAEA